MSDHTSSQFDAEMELIRSGVLSMGGLVETQLQRAIDSLEEREDTNLRDAVGAASGAGGSSDAARRVVRPLKDVYEDWEPSAGQQMRRRLVFPPIGCRRCAMRCIRPPLRSAFTPVT